MSTHTHFIQKHWLPTSTAPYGLMKENCGTTVLSVALAAKTLAEHQSLDSFSAFTAGMLSNIGQLAVTRCFLTTFNEMHSEQLKDAYNNKDKRLHNILVKINTSPDILLEQIVLRSAKLSADLVEQMNFEHLRITEAIFDLAYAQDAKKMCPLAQIVAKAKAFIAFRSLAKEELINADETKAFLQSVNLSTSEISLLKKSDIDHIKLNFS